MGAKDLYPDRFRFALHKLRTLIDASDRVRVGVLLFCGRSYLLAPPTTDHEALGTMLDHLSLEGIDRQGSDWSALLRSAAVFREGNATLPLLVFATGEGIDDPKARVMGIGLYKIGMVWPLEPDGLKAFASDCDELLFVEEKRPLVEDQAKGILYGEERRSRIVGKFNVDGAPLLPSDRPLEAAMVADAIADRLESVGALEAEVEGHHAEVRNRINRNLHSFE